MADTLSHSHPTAIVSLGTKRKGKKRRRSREDFCGKLGGVLALPGPTTGKALAPVAFICEGGEQGPKDAAADGDRFRGAYNSVGTIGMSGVLNHRFFG